MAYAEATKVSVEKSVAEIVILVRKNAESQIALLDDDDRYVIARRFFADRSPARRSRHAPSTAAY